VAPEDCDRLSDDDARILGLESGTITGHTLKLIVLEPGPDPLELDALRAAVAQRLPREPRATQRVDTSGSEPRWVDATDFDICDHVRRWANPDCVSQGDLWRAVSGLMSEHLDRERPLWVFDVIGPLGDGRVAIAARIHHAMADRIAGVRFMEAVLWDAHLDPQEEKRPGLRSAPAAVRSRLADAWRMPGAVRRELGHPGSRSPFDRPITASGELAFLVAPLADVKAIGASRPTRTTVNDVLLAIVAGGLRTWLGVDQAVTPHLHAQVPVSLHHRDEGASDLGNRDSFINVDLPLAETDPLVRLDRITAETSVRKHLGDAEELYDLFHALGRMKHIGPALQRLAKSAREFSVSTSNVPGPPSLVSVAGRNVQHLFSSSEPAAHHALRISAISCAGDIGIGLCTDPQALPDVARLAVAIENSYAELRSAAIGTQ
jgi:diacylglycerol O-acyltransferase / wax synthase